MARGGEEGEKGVRTYRLGSLEGVRRREYCEAEDGSSASSLRSLCTRLNEVEHRRWLW